MAGYIKLPRDWMDHPALSSPARLTKREAFAWLVEKAAYRELKVNLEGQTVILPRGSLAYSGRYMARAWQWTEPRVRRFLERLEADRLINTTIDANRRIVSIYDYDRNQQAIEESDAAATRRQRGGGAKKNKENNEITEKKFQKASPSERAKRARVAEPELVAGVHAPTARGRLWRDGPAIVMQLTKLPKSEARALLGRMLAETRQDFIRVMEVLGRAQERHPLMDAEAFLMAGARGGPRSREKREPMFGAAWTLEYLQPGGGAAQAYDLDLQAETADE